MSRVEAEAERSIASERLLFVGGLHKSGTSILHRCVADHSRISGFSETGVVRDEGQHLQSIFPPARKWGGMGRFGFQSASHLTERSTLVDQASADQLLREWSRYWDLEKEVLVEKSPPTLIRARFLQALFPRARFVVILRHPIAVSYSTARWVEMPLHQLVGHWVRCHRIFEEDRRDIRRLKVVRYEDFAAEPQRILDSVYRFAGLEPERLTREVKRRTNRKYLRRWTRLKLLPRSATYRKRIVQRYEDAVTSFGYGYSLDESVWL